MEELKTRIKASKSPPEVIVITEVKLKNRSTTLTEAEFKIDGYNITSKGVQSDHGRGIIIYTSTSLSFSELYLNSDFQEHVVVSTRLHGNDTLVIGAVYRSPSSDDENNEKLISLLEEITGRKASHTVIVGDFNYGDIDWEMGIAGNINGPSQAFVDGVRDCFLYQKVDKATRQRGDDRPTLLDLVLINQEDWIDSIKHESPLGLSDHAVLTFEVTGSLRNQVKSTKRYCFNQADYDILRKELSVNWKNILDGKNTEEMWQEIERRIKQAQGKAVPLKEYHKGKIKGRVPLDNETVKLIRKKHRAWQRFIETRSQEKLSEFRRIRNKVRCATRKAVKEHEKEIAANIKENPKKFWRYVNGKTKNKGDIPDLVENGELVTEDGYKAEAFGKFFSEVLTTEPPDAIIPDIRKVNTSLTKYNFTTEVVRKKLKDLKVSKSPGPDLLYPAILKEAAEVLAEPLCKLFQKSAEEHKIPNSWKVAQVCPIFKKGAKNQVQNYRPVSLTSVACKVMESIVRDQIMKYMEENNYFSGKQYGFLPGRSTVLQLLKILDIWTENLDKGNVIEVVYLDIQKAFDTVSHKRLLAKLEALGIGGEAIGWIRDFLGDRQQYVKINEASSKPCVVTSGVPQGSVLGPLLFVSYINDLPNKIKSEIYMFADDTKIFSVQKNRENNTQLQRDVDELQNWSNDWKLKFHPDKCKHMVVTSSSRIQQNNNSIEMSKDNIGTNKTKLEVVKQEKDLGIIFDDTLSFENHISTCIKKASQMMGLIRRSFTSLNAEVFKPIYMALVRSRLEYGQAVWSPYKKGDIKRIEAVQRNATRQICGFKNLCYEERLRILKLPTLYFRRLRGDMIECYKMHNSIYDKTASPFLQSADTNRRGHSKKLFKRRTEKLEIRRNNFINRIVDPWNNLPEEVVNAPSLNSFKNRLDKCWKTHPNKYKPLE